MAVNWLLVLRVVCTVVLVAGGIVTCVFSGIILRKGARYYWDVSAPCQLTNGTAMLYQTSKGKSYYTPSWTGMVYLPKQPVVQRVTYTPDVYSAELSKVQKKLSEQQSTTFCVYDLDEDGGLTRCYLERPSSGTAFGLTVGLLFMFVAGVGSLLAGVVLGLNSEDARNIAIGVVVGGIIGLCYLTRLLGALITAARAAHLYSTLPEAAWDLCHKAKVFASGEVAISVLLLALLCAVPLIFWLDTRLSKLVYGSIATFVLVFELVWLGLGARWYPFGNACNAIPEAATMWRMCAWAEFFACWTPALYSLPLIVGTLFVMSKCDCF